MIAEYDEFLDELHERVCEVSRQATTLQGELMRLQSLHRNAEDALIKYSDSPEVLQSVKTYLKGLI